MTAYLKILFRSVKDSFSRFIAIMAIIALGVGFYSGLAVTTPSFLETGDKFLRDYKLYDFRLLSTIGFTEEDIEAISKEFNEKLADVWNQKIKKHEEKDGAVIVTYENDYRIYINYSEVAIQVDGLEIPALDYKLVRGE